MVPLNSSQQRILIVGNFMWPWYQEACARALEQLGCRVERFGWIDDFHIWSDKHSEPKYRSWIHGLQYKFNAGPIVRGIERRLLDKAEEVTPDIVWFYNVQLISASVVEKMRRMLPRALFVQYANDSPFSEKASNLLWRHFKESIANFDIHFSYRFSDYAGFQEHGAKSVHLLRSYFIPSDDYPELNENIPSKYHSDVVFAGHFENDCRVEMLEAICDSGHKVNIFGGGWNAALKVLRSDSPLRRLYPIQPVTGDDYRYAICGARIALCFLSELNQDTYTRRNFQIPAMKTVMLSQYSEDLAKLFEEDKEVVFFRNLTELTSKIRELLSNQAWQKSVEELGYKKVFLAGHNVERRMSDWLSICSQYSRQKV